MATIPRWLLGKHHTVLTIVGQAVSAAGLLSDGTSKALIAVVDEIESTLEREMDDIRPPTATRRNMVPLVDGHSLRVGVIEVNNGTDPDPLHDFAMDFEVVKVTWTRGTATGSIRTMGPSYYAWDTHRSGLSGPGRQIASMTLQPVDAGASSYGEGLA